MQFHVKHVQWDQPGSASVLEHYAKDPKYRAATTPGSILSARFHGRVVRLSLEAHKDGISYAKVIAIIDATSSERQQSFDGLDVGDLVALPDDMRAFEPMRAKDD